MSFDRNLCYRTVAITATGAVCACTSMPQGTISYNFPKAETQVVVTQSLACNAAGDAVRQVVDVSSKTMYTTDLDVDPWQISPQGLSGAFTDTDLSLTFTDDGRLAGVNITQTGQGSAIAKDIISIAKAAIAVAASAPDGLFDAKGACKVIASFAPPKAPKSGAGAATGGAVAGGTAAGGAAAGAAAGGTRGGGGGVSGGGGGAAGDGGSTPDTPTVTLIYAGTFTYVKGTPANPPDPKAVSLSVRSPAASKAADRLVLKPDTSTEPIHEELKKFLPSLGYTVVIGPSSKKYRAAQWANALDSDVRLKLNSVASAPLSILGPVGDLNSVDEVWQGAAAVPLTSAEDMYFVPIPKAMAFGTQKFNLTLTDAGAISKIGYAKTASADAADTAAAVSGAISGVLTKPTDAQKAAAAQAKADLIYEQQRLAACVANPGSCASK